MLPPHSLEAAYRPGGGGKTYCVAAGMALHAAPDGGGDAKKRALTARLENVAVLDSATFRKALSYRE